LKPRSRVPPTNPADTRIFTFFPHSLFVKLLVCVSKMSAALSFSLSAKEPRSNLSSDTEGDMAALIHKEIPRSTPNEVPVEPSPVRRRGGLNKSLRSPVGNSSCASTIDEADLSFMSDGSEVNSLRGPVSNQSVASDREINEIDDEERASLMYPIMFLLQVRAGLLRRGLLGSPNTQSKAAGSVPHYVVDAPPRPRESSHKGASTGVSSTGASTPASSYLADESSVSQTPQHAPQQFQHQTNRAAAANRSDDEKVARAARGILNKLTVEKFDTLHEQLATCGVKTPAQLALLMREIFEKATEQHTFIGLYADLCQRLESDHRLAPAVGGCQGQPSGFRRLLLEQCQAAFEKLFEPGSKGPNPAQLDPEQREELAARHKRQALGNVKFVGHLLLRGMLSSRLLVECADALLASRKSCPEALEALAALLTVTGSKFDRPDWRCFARLETVFGAISALAQDRNVSPRLRFLLTDVLDRRRAGWVKNGQVSDSRKPQAKPPSCSSGNTSSVATPTSNGRKEQQQGTSTKGRKSPASVKGLIDIVSPDNMEGQQGGSPHETVNKKMRQPESPAKIEPGSKPKKPARQATSLPEQTEALGGSLECILDIARHAPCPQKRGDKSGQGRGAAQSLAASPHHEAMEAPSSKCVTQEGAISPKESPAASATPEANPTTAAAAAASATPKAENGPDNFNVKEFHRELSNALRDLASDRNVAAAVKRIRGQRVPVSCHTAEFVDVITRAAEEKRGPARRSFFAFAAALMASEDSAFDRSRCIEGIAVFFREVYQELCLEVPRLELIVTSEFLPALMSVAPCHAQIAAAFPAEMRSHTGLWLSS